MDFIKEFTQFLINRKRFWLIPLVLILFLLSLIIVLSSSSALSPLIYSLF